MGIIAERQRKRKAVRSRRRLIRLAAAASLLALAVSVDSITEGIRPYFESIQAFSQGEQIQLTLPAYDVYALQLAVFDSGERAAAEAERLQKMGVHCVIWQRDRMRIMADAAYSREALNLNTAKGNEAYVIRDTLEEISVYMRADAFSLTQAKSLLEMPDDLLKAILQSETPLGDIAAKTRELAHKEIDAHPENELYTQLAQSLMNWSALIEKTLKETREEEARSYAAVTMCTLCRELRQALSMLSTASAQRTPSTAADVMPPA